MFNASTLCSTTATRATGTVLCAFVRPRPRYSSVLRSERSVRFRFKNTGGSRQPGPTPNGSHRRDCAVVLTFTDVPTGNSHVLAVVPTRADRTHGAGLYTRCRRRTSFTCVARRWTAHRPCGSRRSSTWILQQYGPRPRCSFRAASPPRVEQGGHASSQHCRSTARRSTTPR